MAMDAPDPNTTGVDRTHLGQPDTGSEDLRAWRRERIVVRLVAAASHRNRLEQAGAARWRQRLARWRFRRVMLAGIRWDVFDDAFQTRLQELLDIQRRVERFIISRNLDDLSPPVA
jgi:hypothetical protein